jgi:hypothetical protein
VVTVSPSSFTPAPISHSIDQRLRIKARRAVPAIHTSYLNWLSVNYCDDGFGGSNFCDLDNARDMLNEGLETARALCEEASRRALSSSSTFFMVRRASATQAAADRLCTLSSSSTSFMVRRAIAPPTISAIAMMKRAVLLMKQVYHYSVRIACLRPRDQAASRLCQGYRPSMRRGASCECC